MSLVSSLVMVRVAALVAFFTTRPVLDVFDLVFLPVTLSLIYVPRMVANVEVIAVSTAFHTLLIMPGFFFFFSCLRLRDVYLLLLLLSLGKLLLGICHEYLKGALAVNRCVVLAIDTTALDDVEALAFCH